MTNQSHKNPKGLLEWVNLMVESDLEQLFAGEAFSSLKKIFLQSKVNRKFLGEQKYNEVLIKAIDMLNKCIYCTPIEDSKADKNLQHGVILSKNVLHNDLTKEFVYIKTLLNKKYIKALLDILNYEIKNYINDVYQLSLLNKLLEFTVKILYESNAKFIVGQLGGLKIFTTLLKQPIFKFNKMNTGKFIENNCHELILACVLKGINLLSTEAQNQLRFKNFKILQILSNLVFHLLPGLNISNLNYSMLLLIFSTFDNFQHEPILMVILCENGLLRHINTAFSIILNEMWAKQPESKYKSENLIINSLNNPTYSISKFNNIFPLNPSKASETCLSNGANSTTRSGCTYSNTNLEACFLNQNKLSRGNKISRHNINNVNTSNNVSFQLDYNSLSDETNDPIAKYYSGEEEYFVEKLGNSHEHFCNSSVTVESPNQSTSLCNVDGTIKPETQPTPIKKKSNTTIRHINHQETETPNCKKLTEPGNVEDLLDSQRSSGPGCVCDVVEHDDVLASYHDLLEVLYSLLAQIFRMYHQNPMAIVKQSTEIFDTMLELVVYSKEPDRRLIRILNRLGKNEKFFVTLLEVGFPLKLHQMLAAYKILDFRNKKANGATSPYITNSPTFCWGDNPYTRENTFNAGNLIRRFKMNQLLDGLQTSVTHFALKNTDPIFSVQCGLCFLKGHFMLKLLATLIDNFCRCGPSHIRILLKALPALMAEQKTALTITTQCHNENKIDPISITTQCHNENKIGPISEILEAFKMKNIENNISPFLYNYENNSVLERIKSLISIICSSLLLIKPHLLREFNQRSQINHHLQEVANFFNQQPLSNSFDVNSITTIAMMLNLTWIFFRVHVEGEEHDYYAEKYAFEEHAREALHTVKHLFVSDFSLCQVFGIEASSSFLKASATPNKCEKTVENSEDFVYLRAENVDYIVDASNAPDNVDKISNFSREVVVSKHIPRDNNEDGDIRNLKFSQPMVEGVKFNYARISAISPVFKVMLDRNETRFMNEFSDPNHMVVISDTRHEELALLNSYVNHSRCDLSFHDFVNDSCQSLPVAEWPELSIILGMIDAHLGVYQLIHRYMIDGLETCLMGSILGLFASYLIKYYISESSSNNNDRNNIICTTKYLNFTKNLQKTQWPSPLILYGEIYRYYQSSHYTNASTYLVNFMRDNISYFMIKRITKSTLPFQNSFRFHKILDKSEDVTVWQTFITEASQYDLLHRQDLFVPLIRDILVGYIQQECLTFDDKIMFF